MNTFAYTIDERGIATLVFDLPGEKVNKLTTPVMNELSNVLDKLEQDRSIRLLCIKSGKPSNFIAGADIAEIMNIGSPSEAEEKSKQGQEIMNRIEALPFPTLAVIDGACLGGGLELALACTYRIASDSSSTSFGFPEVNLGIIPGFGGTQRARRLCGLVASLFLVTSGKPADWKNALKFRIVDAVFPKAFLNDRAHSFVEQVIADSGRLVLAHRRSKKTGARLLEGTFFGRLMIYRQIEKSIERSTRGRYPAPLAALTVIRKTRRSELAKGLKSERTVFAQLAVTEVSKNLIRIYFANEELKKISQVEGSPSNIKLGGGSGGAALRGAVLGSGVMGGAIAWLMSEYDVPVTMVDLDWEFIRKGFQSAKGIYNQFVSIGKIDERTANLKMLKISGATDYKHLARKDIVVEAIVENISIKRKALARLEEFIDERTIVASNTSSLSITEMGSVLKRPDRFGGMHFFNPVNRMPLVEIIAGEKTSIETIRALAAFAKTLHKVPIVVKDSPGFLVNRILMTYLNEAALMVEEGIDFEKIDRAIYDFGMPMGPFSLLDEIGIDIASEVGKTLARAFQDRIKSSGLFELLREKKLLGKKTGAGFFIYKNKKRTINKEAGMLIVSRYSKSAKTTLTGEDIVKRCVYPMINEAALCLEEGIIDRPDFLDMAMILGIGFPAFRGGPLRFADQTGVASIVETLKEFERRYGRRFSPSKLLLEKREKGFFGTK